MYRAEAERRVEEAERLVMEHGFTGRAFPAKWLIPQSDVVPEVYWDEGRLVYQIGPDLFSRSQFITAVALVFL